jgi:hypothetical protein
MKVISAVSEYAMATNATSVAPTHPRSPGFGTHCSVLGRPALNEGERLLSMAARRRSSSRSSIRPTRRAVRTLVRSLHAILSIWRGTDHRSGEADGLDRRQQAELMLATPLRRSSVQACPVASPPIGASRRTSPTPQPVAFRDIAITGTNVDVEIHALTAMAAAITISVA